MGILNSFNEMTTIAYDPLGREQVKVLGNGVQVSHSYDPAGREVMLAQFGPAGAALAMYSAVYDNVGNRTGVVELDGTLVTYGYDASNQLALEERSGVNAYAVSYSYDGAGNRTLEGDSGQFTAYAYGAANELVLITPPSGQPTTISYDANGNQDLENAGGQLTSYVWDFENRLTGVAYPVGTIGTYAYSADGMRQKEVTTDGEADFVWDGVNVLLEADAAGSTQADYTDYPGMWGGLVSERRSGASSYYGTDLQASVRMLLSGAAAVTDQYLYRAFGDEVSSSGSTTNPYQYVGAYGYYLDAETGLMLLTLRYYDAEVGRFVTRDPIGFRGGDWNVYGYVFSNPVSDIDPGGLSPVAEPPTIPQLVEEGRQAIETAVGTGFRIGGNILGKVVGGVAALIVADLISPTCTSDGDPKQLECENRVGACQKQCSDIYNKNKGRRRYLGGLWIICCSSWCSINYWPCMGHGTAPSWGCKSKNRRETSLKPTF